MKMVAKGFRTTMRLLLLCSIGLVLTACKPEDIVYTDQGLAATGYGSPAYFFLKASAVPGVNFSREVFPLLQQHGCATAGCHDGSRADGLDFRDVLDLYTGLHQRSSGRGLFLDVVVPQESLLLRAGLAPGQPGRAPHPEFENGLVYDGKSYRLIQRWIEQGARND